MMLMILETVYFKLFYLDCENKNKKWPCSQYLWFQNVAEMKIDEMLRINVIGLMQLCPLVLKSAAQDTTDTAPL